MQVKMTRKVIRNHLLPRERGQDPPTVAGTGRRLDPRPTAAATNVAAVVPMIGTEASAFLLEQAAKVGPLKKE